jgi:hypothetical protein
MFSRFGRAQGSLLPHHLTGRQAPLKGKAPVVRFVGVVKTKRYKKWGQIDLASVLGLFLNAL